MSTEREQFERDIEQMQIEWLVAQRQLRRTYVVADADGQFSVHQHTADGVAPHSTYPTVEQAAARLLQLLGITAAIAPQSWPERVEIRLDAEPSE